MADLVAQSRPVKDNPHAVEVTVSGHMRSTSVSTFKNAVEQAMAGKPCILLLGLKGISFLPSITLSYLADLFGRLEKRGGAIALVESDSKIRIVLNSLGLDQFFSFFEDFDAARAFALTEAGRLKASPRIIVSRGPGEGQEFPITATPITVGSHAEATLRVQAPRIEPHHAEFGRRDDRCYVKDLGSKSGTQVNLAPVREHLLQDGSVVRIADLELIFRAAE